MHTRPSVNMLMNAYLLLALTVAPVCRSNLQNDNIHKRDSNDVIIQTTHGKLLGKTEKIQGRYAGTVDVDVFWGIPYAKPPVGDLRFKRPEPYDSWNGVFRAVTPPNTCVQASATESILEDVPPNKMSEDCLYLNIWRPNCLDAKRRMATMLWIHGGSFMTGSSVESAYNGATLAAFECVIVATVNYRLGPFGFMYLNSEDSPGNMGLLDVTLALRWIKDNADNFEGNPDRITLFGNDAGGAIASMFLVSPLARDLFYNVIIQSGNPFFKFFYQSVDSAFTSADKLAMRVNCTSIIINTVIRCFRQVSVTKLAQAHASLAATDVTYSMVPVSDSIFLPNHPMSYFLLGDVKRCNLMIGTTKDEGTYVLERLMPGKFNYSVQYTRSMNDEQMNQVLTQLFATAFKEQNIKNVIAKVRTLYEYDDLKKQLANPSLMFLNFVIRDFVFACAANEMATVYAILSHTVFMYRYDYIRESPILPDWIGATHGSEVPLIFRTTTHTFPQISPSDAKLSETMMKMWANFAQYGNPTPWPTSRPRWAEYTRNDPALMVFREDAGLRLDRVDMKYCEYWNDIPKDYLQP